MMVRSVQGVVLDNMITCHVTTCFRFHYNAERTDSSNVINLCENKPVIMIVLIKHLVSYHFLLLGFLQSNR